MFGGRRSRHCAGPETEESVIDRLARLACQMVAGVFFRKKILGQGE